MTAAVTAAVMTPTAGKPMIVHNIQKV